MKDKILIFLLGILLIAVPCQAQITRGGSSITRGSSAATDLTSAVTWTIGDGSSGDVVLTYNGDAGTDGTQTWDVSEDAFVYNRTLKLFTDAAPTGVDTAGDMAFDTNIWGSGRGSILVYDGTAVASVVAIQISDTCNNGERPNFNTGGTWDCVPDADTAGVTIGDTYVAYATSEDTLGGEAAYYYNDVTNTLFVDSITLAPSVNPTSAMYDSDTTDGDISAQIVTDCTDTGSGTEDCDMWFEVQVGGTMTEMIEINADGNTTITNLSSSSHTNTKCIWLEDPVATDDLESIIVNKTSGDWTLTEMWGESDQTVNFDFQVDDGSPADVNGTDLAPAAGEAEDTSLSGDTELAAGEELDLAITSVSGTPTWLSACVTYTY